MADLVDMMAKPTARELADQGMARAAEHADRVSDGWSDNAYQFLRVYAQACPEFMTEQLRVWAHDEGLPKPPDNRAWGAVVNRAVRDGIIVRDRFENIRIPPSHSRPMPVWKSRLYRCAA